MNAVKRKRKQARRRALHVRNRLRQGSDRPRLSVFRSARHIFAQVIDDSTQRTICAVGTTGKEHRTKGSGNIEGAREIGKKIAELAVAKGISKVSLDRGQYRYHGRVKALAEAAREGGLVF